MGGILCGRNPVGEESRVGGILWEESRVGGILWEESCWEESRGRNPMGRKTMTTELSVSLNIAPAKKVIPNISQKF